MALILSAGEGERKGALSTWFLSGRFQINLGTSVICILCKPSF